MYVITSISSSYFYTFILIVEQNALSNSELTILIVFDIYYLTCILKKFLTEFTPVGEIAPVRDLFKIAHHYLYNDFLIDFILWLPLNFIAENYNYIDAGNMIYARDFLFIKIYRLIYATRVFKDFELQQFMIKKNIERNKARIQKDRELGEDTLTDHNKIFRFVMIGHALKILKLVIQI